MTNLGDAFAAFLHAEHLKLLGFTKRRHRFARVRDSYTEHHQIQGSAWNSAGGPWTFYLNCGVGFVGLPPRTPDKDFSDTHFWARAEALAPGAQPQYGLTAENMAALSAEVAAVIVRCSEYFESNHEALRQAYVTNRSLLAGTEQLR